MTKEKEQKKEVVVKEPNAIQRYLRETTAELRKVSWPTRHEATYLTTMVIVVVVALSTFLAIFDVIFARLFGLILKA